MSDLPRDLARDRAASPAVGANDLSTFGATSDTFQPSGAIGVQLRPGGQADTADAPAYGHMIIPPAYLDATAFSPDGQAFAASGIDPASEALGHWVTASLAPRADGNEASGLRDTLIVAPALSSSHSTPYLSQGASGTALAGTAISAAPSATANAAVTAETAELQDVLASLQNQADDLIQRVSDVASTLADRLAHDQAEIGDQVETALGTISETVTDQLVQIDTTISNSLTAMQVGLGTIHHDIGGVTSAVANVTRPVLADVEAIGGGDVAGGIQTLVDLLDKGNGFEIADPATGVTLITSGTAIASDLLDNLHIGLTDVSAGDSADMPEDGSVAGALLGITDTDGISHLFSHDGDLHG